MHISIKFLKNRVIDILSTGLIDAYCDEHTKMGKSKNIYKSISFLINNELMYPINTPIQLKKQHTNFECVS